MTARCVRLSLRNVDSLITSLMLPVMLMLLFVYLFGGAIETGTKYVTYVVPGVLLLCAGFGSSLTAVSVSTDLKEGIVDRLRSMDVGGTAFLGGHVLASVARNAASTVLVFGVAVLIGFRSPASPLHWLAAAGVLLLFVLAMSWFSAAVGVLTKSPEAASGFTFFVMFLPYPSSAFVPIDTMPGWLHGFARHQPATPVIETLRGLLLDHPGRQQPVAGAGLERRLPGRGDRRLRRAVPAADALRSHRRCILRRMRFRSTVELGGKTATGIGVPEEVVTELGSGKRPAVRVTINDHTYRSTVAPMGGRFMLPLSAENRQGAGVAAGDEVDVEVELDTEPREVTVPPDFAAALAQDAEAQAYFDSMSYSHRLRWVLSVEGAKTAETRERRIDKAVSTLHEGPPKR